MTDFFSHNGGAKRPQTVGLWGVLPSSARDVLPSHGADRNGCAVRWGCLPTTGKRCRGRRWGGRGSGRGETTAACASEGGQQRNGPAGTTKWSPGIGTDKRTPSFGTGGTNGSQFQPTSATERRRSAGDLGGVSGGGSCGGCGGRERRWTTSRYHSGRKRDEPGGSRRSWISRTGDLRRDNTGYRDAGHGSQGPA